MDYGTIGWMDLTVGDADALREFYRKVVGWEASEADMGGYADYVMSPAGTQQAVAGICHARGVNEGLPSVWLVYITVEDLDAAVARCKEAGGTVVHGPTVPGPMGRYAVIRDPAGAHCALFEPVLAA